jgi:hypothetical protein
VFEVFLTGSGFVEVLVGRLGPGEDPWTRARHATQPGAASEDLRFGDSRYIAATRRRCQRAAPHRTNDVDTDQRRRTLDGLPNPDPLTQSAIEGGRESRTPDMVGKFLGGQGWVLTS